MLNWAGKKGRIQLGAIVQIIGGALSAGSISPAMFTVARLVTGIGIGLLMTSIPMYQFEVPTPESRGFMTCMHGAMFAVGYSLATYIGLGTFFAPTTISFGFRFPRAFQIAPCLF